MEQNSKQNSSSAMAHPIIVFTDGACSGNPGPGGWAAIIATPEGQVTELGGRENDTTNNQMEMTAVGKALRHLEGVEGPVHVYTDSTYVIFGITKWIWGWKKNGWMTKEGAPVANAEYWKRLLVLVSARKSESKVEWKYVRGHRGIPGNERVDEIAVAFSKGQRVDLFQGSLLKYDVAIHDVPEDTEAPEMRPREKSAPAYGYVSMVGAIAQRHATWKECEARVKGVSGAKFKKVASPEEEAEVLASWGAKIS